MFSLSRARSNINELYYKEEPPPASQPVAASISAAELEPASSGMFSLSRARSNVNELYDKEEPPPASQPVAASISAAELEPASNGMFSLSRVRSNMNKSPRASQSVAAATGDWNVSGSVSGMFSSSRARSNVDELCDVKSTAASQSESPLSSPVPLPSVVRPGLRNAKPRRKLVAQLVGEAMAITRHCKLQDAVVSGRNISQRLYDRLHDTDTHVSTSGGLVV